MNRLKLACEMHSSVWHRPAGAGAREQVTNWMNCRGHVPRSYAENSNLETIGRHRPGRWKNPLIIGAMLLMLPLAADPGAARDPDGRYANSPLKQWFDSLRSGKGPCCSDADGSAVSDVDASENLGPSGDAVAHRTTGTRPRTARSATPRPILKVMAAS